METKLILSLDGGGIRGVATIKFLEKLEETIGKRVCDIFDMFIGTSTGGIIAAAIGLLKLKCSEVAKLYSYENANEIMDISIFDKVLGLKQTKPKYDGKGKRRVLKKYFKNKLLNDAEKPLLLVTYDVEKRSSKVLKSYSEEKVLALDAVDSTSAAPLYFPTVKVNEKWLIDGGVIANNPTMCGFAEGYKIWNKANIKILSVGTGKRVRKIDGKKSQDFGILGWASNDLLGVVMDETVVEYQASSILKSNYLRVNSDLNEASDDMDDCSRGNIKNLKELGKYWSQKFGEKAKKLIGEK